MAWRLKDYWYALLGMIHGQQRKIRDQRASRSSLASHAVREQQALESCLLKILIRRQKRLPIPAGTTTEEMNLVVAIQEPAPGRGTVCLNGQHKPLHNSKLMQSTGLLVPGGH